MKKFEILEHIADLKIRAFGRDKKELFLNAMIGMYRGARYVGKDKKTKREITISALDLPSLFVDFLNELLYLTEIHREVYETLQFKKFDNQHVGGILIGKKLKRMGVLIKGATYHQLQIHQKKNGTWEAVVLFDI